tara:strand:+ start:2444 stop:3319 length:876 start_codon:yes stop_codon:yes gene_type:complete
LIGIFSAIGAVFSWTYACSIWRNQTTLNKPIHINFVKNLLAFLIFIPAFTSIDFTKDSQYIFILIISGIIGIGIGDTFYLNSLNKIGTRKTLSIEAISPIIAAFSGKLFINENLSIKSWIGIFIVTVCLILIIKKQTYLIDKDKNFILKKFNFWNYIYSFLSVFCAVIAALLSRIVFLESNLNPAQTTEIRLFGSIIFLFLITKTNIEFSLDQLNIKDRLKFIFSIILGTNVGIFLQQVAFKELPLGIAWTLLSTSPIISLFFSKKEEGDLSRDIIFLTSALFAGIVLIVF